MDTTSSVPDRRTSELVLAALGGGGCRFCGEPLEYSSCLECGVPYCPYCGEPNGCRPPCPHLLACQAGAYFDPSPFPSGDFPWGPPLPKLGWEQFQQHREACPVDLVPLLEVGRNEFALFDRMIPRLGQPVLQAQWLNGIAFSAYFAQQPELARAEIAAMVERMAEVLRDLHARFS